MKKLLLLMLFCAGCARSCYPLACYDEIEKAAGEGSEIRPDGFGQGWFVRRANGELWRFRTSAAFSCEVTGKEKIF